MACMTTSSEFPENPRSKSRARTSSFITKKSSTNVERWMPYGETKADYDGGKSHLPDLPTVAVQRAQQQAQTSNASSRDVRADVTSQILSTRDHTKGRQYSLRVVLSAQGGPA